MDKKFAKGISLALTVGLLLPANVNEGLAKSNTIKLNKKKLTLTVKKNYSLKLTKAGKKVANRKIKWKSSKTKIATVSKTGLVKAKKAGTATITAIYNKKKYRCNLTVKANVKNNANTANAENKEEPGATATSAAEPAPTIVPTPDVQPLSLKLIEMWNQENDSFNVVKNEENNISFISGKVFEGKVTDKDQAYEAVSAIKLLDDANKDLDLVYLQTDKDLNGDIYYRFCQYVNGSIIPGAYAVLGTDEDGDSISYMNCLIPDTSKINDENMISASRALRNVKKEVADFVREETVEPYLDIRYGANGLKCFCWTVVGKNTQENEANEEFCPYIKYFVEATTGELIFREEAFAAEDLTANHEVNYKFPKAETSEMAFTNAWGEEVMLPVAKNKEGKYYFIDTKRKIEAYGAVDASTNQYSTEPYTFEKAEDVSPNFVSAMDNIIRVYDLLASYGYRSVDGQGKCPIRIYLGYVRDGQEVRNAFAKSPSNGSQVFVVSDTSVSASLDVIAHEYTHAVQGRKASTEYSFLTGANMEAIADILGNLEQMILLDEKHCDKKEWAVAENQDGTQENALRVMGQPELGDSPRKVGGLFWISAQNDLNSNDYGGVHTNSGVLNYICYSLYKDKKIDMSYEDYFKVWFTTVFLFQNRSSYNEYRAYLRYAMDRHSFSQYKAAVDDVFKEANTENVDIHNWNYELQKDCSYLVIDKKDKKASEDISVWISYVNEEGKKQSVQASDYGENQAIAMVPKGVDVNILYELEPKEGGNYYLIYQDSASMEKEEVKVSFDYQKLIMNYADYSAWAYHPTVLEKKEQAAVEVFFVNPTAVKGSKDEQNMYVYDKSEKQAFVNAINMEKDIYDTKAHFYAPYYRQQTLAAYELQEDERKPALQIAWKDIVSAFISFLGEHKKGTPIILAGFSQGSELIKNIVKNAELFDLTLASEENGEHLFTDDFVAAYAPGWYFEDGCLSESSSIKMAQGETDTSVVVTFCSEAEDYKENTVIFPKDIHTNGINPLNWKTDSTVATKEENMGACFPNKQGLINNAIPSLCGAYLDSERGTLKVTDIKKADYPASLSFVSEGNYHIYDYQFFYMNLKNNVRKRLEAFNKKHK